MPTLEFKGKQHVYAHHLTVPFRPLLPDPARSCHPAGGGEAQQLREVRQRGEYHLRGWRRERIYPDFIAMAGQSAGRPHLLVFETRASTCAATRTPTTSAGYCGRSRNPSTWAIKVSGNWRIVFRFEDGEAVDVDFVDYH